MASEATGAGGSGSGIIIAIRGQECVQVGLQIEAALRAEREMLREFEVRRAHPKKRHRAKRYLAAARRAALEAQDLRVLRRFMWNAYVDAFRGTRTKPV